jgi:hypothetical protein
MKLRIEVSFFSPRHFSTTFRTIWIHYLCCLQYRIFAYFANPHFNDPLCGDLNRFAGLGIFSDPGFPVYENQFAKSRDRKAVLGFFIGLAVLFRPESRPLSFSEGRVSLPGSPRFWILPLLLPQMFSFI